MNAIIYNGENIFPSKVVCIGRNYKEHIKELNNETPKEMVFFIKPNSAISDTLCLQKNQSACHYEAEISFLIKDNQLYAVGFGLDLTLRELQNRLKAKGLPWERAKAFNGSAVFSNFTPFKYKDENLEIELYINNKCVQKASVAHMINRPYEILKEAQTFLSFEDGDIIMSGTPSGVGEIKIGDIFVGKILQKSVVLLEKKWEVLSCK